jgi:hypothetical protein
MRVGGGEAHERIGEQPINSGAKMLPDAISGAWRAVHGDVAANVS